MRIPVFVSCPTSLSREQEGSRSVLIERLQEFGMEARALGRTDYPTDLPLREVRTIARHCSGGLILGFTQFRADQGVWKPGTKEAKKSAGPVEFPTSWNHLEAGILYSLDLPLLVFREPAITGGVFDPGVTDVFVHRMPPPKITKKLDQELAAVFLKWSASVQQRYYEH